MPKSGKRKPAKQPPIVSIVQASMKSLFDFAATDEEYADRRTPTALQDWMRGQNWGDSVSKSHLYRMEKGEGPHVLKESFLRFVD